MMESTEIVQTNTDRTKSKASDDMAPGSQQKRSQNSNNARVTEIEKLTNQETVTITMERPKPGPDRPSNTNCWG
jgi:hypothetical protein